MDNEELHYKFRKAFRLEYLPHLTEAQFQAFKALCQSEGRSMAWKICNYIKQLIKGDE